MLKPQNSRPVLYLTAILALVISLCLNLALVRASSFSQNALSGNPNAFTWQKVIAPDGTSKDGFGHSAAISDDGSTAIVGSYYIEFGITYPIGPGGVYIFTNDAGTWVLQQKLPTPDMPDSDLFGFSVALSADGNTALVGAQGGTGPVDTQVPGTAYIFTRSEGVWSQQAMLTASDRQVGDHFGVSVALSDSGDTALIGAYVDDVGANTNQGSAYVYQRSGNAWTEQAHLTSTDAAAGDYFGRSVALSADGSMALIGADMKTIGANTAQGAAYIFTRASTTWSQQTRLTDINGGGYEWFGVGAALSADGQTALVGADGTGAFVFTASGGIWTQQALLTDGSAYLGWGNSIALSADGNTALVEDGFTFTRHSGSWIAGERLLADDSPSGFGSAVALSGDASLALIGASYATIGANQSQGAAYFFTKTSSGPQTSIYLPLIVR
ncbi:MAG TPA: hypothetical protein PLT26_09930 [Anaerolineaceae bacterium]|nr:hypothetical protein [Anaerolineaceae bacterium]HQH85870.1 hypothetical protein [Anaerolineaceae bacterium]